MWAPPPLPVVIVAAAVAEIFVVVGSAGWLAGWP